MEIVSVRSLLSHLEQILPGPSALFRGQPVDEPLLPKVARNEFRVDHAQHEEKFMDEFRRRAHALANVASLSTWQLMALAQHVGAPTRFLDWTRSPLAALWFAVASSRPVGKATAVLWLLKHKPDDFTSGDDMKASPFALTRIALTRTKLYKPDHISPRVAAQDGYFSVHKYWQRGKRYVPLDEHKEFRDRLAKFVIKRGREPFITAELDRLGINSASLFPDLWGLANHLAARYEFVLKNQFIASAYNLDLHGHLDP